MIKTSGIIKWLLVGILSFVMLAVGIPEMTSYAADEEYPVIVEVSIPGGGIAKIESIDYVPRSEDPEEESIAQQWIWFNDPECLPSQTTLNVPESTGLASFEWNIPADKAFAGVAYAFKITQVPGTDPNVRYDEKEYYLEVFFEDVGEGGAKKIVHAWQIRDDSEFDTKDYKPDKCEFENIETKTVKRTITYTEYTPDGKEIFKPVIQEVKLERPKGSTGPWTIVSGDQSAKKSPEYTTDLGKWTPSRDEVPIWEIDLNDPQDAYENVYYTPPDKPKKPLKPRNDETWGKRGEKQTGWDPNTKYYPFEPGDSDIVSIKFIDPRTGKPTNAKTIDALDKNGKVIGTYTLNDDGSVTFAPDKDFVGDPQPAKLLGEDANGFTAIAVYQPHVTDDPPTTTKKEVTTTKQNKKSPKTGDDTDTIPYMILLIGAFATMSVIYVVKRRRSNS